MVGLVNKNQLQQTVALFIDFKFKCYTYIANKNQHGEI